jgi:hypothetical protein
MSESKYSASLSASLWECKTMRKTKPDTVKANVPAALSGFFNGDEAGMDAVTRQELRQALSQGSIGKEVLCRVAARIERAKAVAAQREEQLQEATAQIQEEQEEVEQLATTAPHEVPFLK